MGDRDATAARSFLAEARRAFGFLHSEFGFEGPLTDDGPFAVWIVFKGPASAVKISYDTRDQLVEVFLVRLVDDRLPPYDETEATHYVDSRSLLRQSGLAVAAAEFDLKSRSREEFRRVLRRNADVIKEFGDILGGDF